ncbi:MAG: hypothetical protein EOP50_12700 [Sphingobacteriales bacterium]|nr:MAG: hypothetical protein EOP50_12700 [Sphingobacteriales bacterium]
MPRLTAFFCILLLLLATCGRSLLFRLQLAEVRAEMRRTLNRGEKADGAESFAFSHEEARSIHWLDGGGEFDWKGTRYDVLARQQVGRILLVEAVADHKESQLVSRFQKEQQDERLPSKNLQKLLSVPYLPVQPISLAQLAMPKPEFPAASTPATPKAVIAVPTPPPLS